MSALVYSVVCVLHDSAGPLRALLASLERLPERPPLIVVDTASNASAAGPPASPSTQRTWAAASAIAAPAIRVVAKANWCTCSGGSASTSSSSRPSCSPKATNGDRAGRRTSPLDGCGTGTRQG